MSYLRFLHMLPTGTGLNELLYCVSNDLFLFCLSHCCSHTFVFVIVVFDCYTLSFIQQNVHVTFFSPYAPIHTKLFCRLVLN